MSNHYHQNGKIFAPAKNDPNGYGAWVEVDREDVDCDCEDESEVEIHELEKAA